MDQRRRNIDAVHAFYRALQAQDMNSANALLTDDVELYILGRTPLSGRWVGKHEGMAELAKRVFALIEPATWDFGRNYKIVCADDAGVVAFFLGGGRSIHGKAYDQTYLELFRFRGDRISRIYEMVDTVMIEDALLDNPLARPERNPPLPLDMSLIDGEGPPARTSS